MASLRIAVGQGGSEIEEEHEERKEKRRKEKNKTEQNREEKDTYLKLRARVDVPRDGGELLQIGMRLSSSF
ncbi:hypothetical protein Taro_021691 [Colocasia esculenta]|uniref:Uncharacterized protein n=1 Tax=Colocasia esculenta TaxID=4460 RepID=A0A843V1X5_COLES|nr:hypothetical protein [Colocasia esculenta]